MSKASRKMKQFFKDYNISTCGVGYKYPRKFMTLKFYKAICRELSKWGRRNKRKRRNFWSRPEMHLKLKRIYK